MSSYISCILHSDKDQSLFVLYISCNWTFKLQGICPKNHLAVCRGPVRWKLNTHILLVWAQNGQYLSVYSGNRRDIPLHLIFQLCLKMLALNFLYSNILDLQNFISGEVYNKKTFGTASKLLETYPYVTV